jgi:hypothetical protein
MSSRFLKGLALGDITEDVFKKPVKGPDVLVGGAAMLLGLYVINWSKSRWASLFPPALLPFAPAIAGLLGGGIMYMVDKKMIDKPESAGGHALGALSAGLAVTALNFLKGRYPVYFADVVDLRLAGLIVNDPQTRRMNGLIVNDPQRRLSGYADNPALGDLASLSMAIDDSDDIEQLIG